MDGAAYKKGIRCGDRVIAVDGNEVKTFETLELVLTAIERPVTFRLERRRGSNDINSGGTSTSPSQQERRRQAILAAAVERNQAWGKKVQASKAAFKEEREEADRRFRPATDEKTLATVAHVKAVEQQNAALYESHSYGQNAARARIELSAHAPAHRGGAGVGNNSTTGLLPPPFPQLGASSGYNTMINTSLSPGGIATPPSSGEPPIPPLSSEEVRAAACLTYRTKQVISC